MRRTIALMLLVGGCTARTPPPLGSAPALEATIAGMTTAGRAFRGTDVVRVIP